MDLRQQLLKEWHARAAHSEWSIGLYYTYDFVADAMHGWLLNIIGEVSQYEDILIDVDYGHKGYAINLQEVNIAFNYLQLPWFPAKNSHFNQISYCQQQ